jgi:hypothetical protein
VTEPNEPATKGDLEKLRQEMHERSSAIERSVEGMRGQNSAEHGSLFSKLTYITEMLVWVKTRWEKFTRSPDRTWPGDKK